MTIDQMIKQLQTIKKTEGNLDIFTDRSDGMSDAQLTLVDDINVFAMFNANGDTDGSLYVQLS